MRTLASKCRSLLLLLVASLAVSFSAAAEEVALRLRSKPGDTYRLSLSVLTNTEAFSKGAGGETFEETVRLQYKASVRVLEVDAEGRPVREQHDRASLTFERPGDSGSLFQEGVTIEVVRRDGVEIFLANRRIDRKLETILAEVLEKQFEYTLEPALLEPGRPVEVGESWKPNESLARRFLLSRGVRVIDFGEDPVATLQREPQEDGGAALVIDYSIPIARFELTRMPPNTEASKTEARLEGRVLLAKDPGQAPISARSNLTLSLKGMSRTAAQSLPWSVRSSVTVEKSSSESHDLAALSTGVRSDRLR